MKRSRLVMTSLLYLFLSMTVVASLPEPLPAGADAPGARPGALAAQAPEPPLLFYLPLALNNHPNWSPFGAEANAFLTSGPLLERATALKVGWVRLTDRAQWSVLQPVENGPIRWELLGSFESELRAINAAGIIPIVPVDAYPLWAVISEPFPTMCGALRADKFDEFAQFMRALVARYKTPEFNVHDWELGNEPDVDPTLVAPDSTFGCWGDIDDPFYGGRHYGEMLKVVGPAIKAEDPSARVWFGGLLLDNPNTSEPGRGRPELFLQGALEAGAAPYFDVLAYHAYRPYLNLRADYDNVVPGAWDAWGGYVVGKARYLRQMMSQYGVNKPLFLNEFGLMCIGPEEPFEGKDYCGPPDAQFYQMQADHLVRSFVRGLAENLMGFIWFTLDGPGWRNVGLLDGNGNPKPVYVAYQQLIAQLRNAHYIAPVNYGSGIEAYEFRKSTPIYVHVVWTRDDVSLQLTVPQSRFVQAYNWDGTLANRASVGASVQLQVGFDPIYIVLLP